MRSFRQKPIGWRNESYRHSLSARGLTNKYMVSKSHIKRFPSFEMQRYKDLDVNIEEIPISEWPFNFKVHEGAQAAFSANNNTIYIVPKEGRDETVRHELEHAFQLNKMGRDKFVNFSKEAFKIGEEAGWKTKKDEEIAIRLIKPAERLVHFKYPKPGYLSGLKKLKEGRPEVEEKAADLERRFREAMKVGEEEKNDK